MPITYILDIRWKNFLQGVRVALSQQQKPFSRIFIAFSQSGQNFVHFKKEDQLSYLTISEIIESENYDYLNTLKLLFQNTLRQSTWSRVLNSAETTMAALLSKLSIDPTYIELENISVSEIWNVRTVWQHIECRWNVFSSLDEKKLRKVFHCNYLKNEKRFVEFLSHFRNVYKILSILKEKISFIT